MFEEIRNKRIASFCLGDEYIGIVPSEMIKSANSYSKKIGELSIVVHFAEVAHNFYYWTVFLKNNGRVNTEQITNFYGMDIDIPVSGKTLWQSIRGDDCNGDSFMPLSEELHEDSVILHEAVEGRSSQHTAFPYFDITSDCGSAVFAIGWTGQWSYILTRTDNNLSLKAGFTDFDLYLAPGESVRSVGALVYTGKDLLKTRQDFRRIFRTKLSPAAKNGGSIELPLSLQVFDLYFRKNPDWATEQGQIKCINSAEKCGYFNTYWLDAAWFRDGFPHGVGNYEFEKGFPNGLLPVSRCAHEKGFKFMLWFEPERNYQGSDTVAYHMDKLLDVDVEDNKAYLFNLSDEKAFEWLRDTLVGMIRDNGIDIYRQDFNINPLRYWRFNDKEGKKGYTENKYITNLYRLLDALLAEFPGLMIDNCASGGRRLDFEMNMRSFPLWRSDTGCFPASEERPTYLWHQNQTIGLSRYLPYHTTASWTAEANTFRSAETMGIACTFDVMSDDFDFNEAKKPLDEFVNLRHYWDGDFYPLTEATIETDCWCAYQLALDNSGFCAFFRREDSDDAERIFEINSIDQNMTYEISLTDNNYIKTTKTVKGDVLASFKAYIPSRNESLILEYRAISK